jgi:hypothetical protein
MTDNTMANGQQTNDDRLYNGKKTTGQTMTDNTVAKEQQEKQ